VTKKYFLLMKEAEVAHLQKFFDLII
jgi:hypothetical protein